MSDDFFIIISGSVGLYKKKNQKSKPVFIEELTQGETIDEMRAIQNRTCAFTVITTKPVVALHTSISKLHALENDKCHTAIVDSIIKIITDRLFHSNETIANKIHEKKRKNKQIILILFCMLVLIIFFFELGLGLYYTLNPSDFCNEVYSLPAEKTKVSL
jgi:CRP-like cAMP-binding protein